jgi:hypothetical protein
LQDVVNLSRNQKELRAETVIGALATLAGERLLLSAGQEISRSRHGLEHDDMAPETASASAVIVSCAEAAGVPEASLRQPAAIARAASAQIGLTPLPPLSVPRQHYPQDRSANAIAGLRDVVRRNQASWRFCNRQMNLVLCHVIGRYIVQIRDRLDPATATTLAMETMIGVTLISPLAQEVRLASRQSA